MFKRDIQWFCSRFVACAALCAILSVPALAKDSQETVGNGSPDIFIKKLSGSSQQPPRPRTSCTSRTTT
jgi:hypothetical protein